MSLHQYCDYYFDTQYNDPVDDVDKIALQNVTVNDLATATVIVYPDYALHYLPDTAGCESWLNSLGIGTFSVSYDGTTWSVQSIFNSNLLLQIRLVKDKNGTPITSEYDWVQENCHYAFDPSIVRGCTDPDAVNYDPDAEENDGSCRYTPTEDVDRWEACITEKRNDLLEKLRRGEKECCGETKLWTLNKALQIVRDYVPAGTIITPGIPVSDAAAATVDIDLSTLNENGSFIDIALEVNGITIIDNSTFVNDFYDTLADFIDALVIEINAYGLYTATNVGYVITLTAPTTGTVYNGLPVICAVRQDYFYQYKEFDTQEITPPRPAVTPQWGCYDPYNQKVLFGGGSQDIAVMNQDDQTGIIIYDPEARAVVHNKYNPADYTSLRFYASTSAGAPASFNSAYSYLGLLPVTAPIPGAYNTIMVFFDEQVGYLYVSAGTGKIAIYDCTTPDFETPVGWNDYASVSNIYNMRKNPLTLSGSAPYGEYVFAVEAYQYVWAIHPTTLATTTFDIPALILAANPSTLFTTTYCGEFVWNPTTNNMEYWIAGYAPVIAIFDAATMTYIEEIDIDPITSIHDMKQNSSNGYVFISSSSATSGVDNEYSRMIDPGTRHINHIVGTPDLAKANTSQGIVEDEGTGMMFYGEDAFPGLGGPYTGIQVIDNIRSDVAITGEFDGGANAVTIAIPPVVQGEDDVCVDSDQITKFEQYLNRECKSCN